MSEIWTTREHFGLDQDEPRHWVDSDDDEEGEDEDEDEGEGDTINRSKRRSYAPPSIDRHSLSSESSLSRTETGTVRGRPLSPLSLVIPNVSSDDTLVNTSNSSAEPEGAEDEDELEERRMSIRFSDPRYQTTPFDLDAFHASVISVKQRRSQAPTTLSMFAKPPSPLLSISQLDTTQVQYNSNRTRAWSDDSDGASSRRTSLLSDDPGSPRSEYQELEIVNTRPSLRTEFHLVCAFSFLCSPLNPDLVRFLRPSRKPLPSLQTGQTKEDRAEILSVHKTLILNLAPRGQPPNQNETMHSTRSSHPQSSSSTISTVPSVLPPHADTRAPTRTTTNSRGSSPPRH